MRTTTSLIRIRFPLPLVELLDSSAKQLGVTSRKRIPRAALVRALLSVHIDAMKREGRLPTAPHADTVRPGVKNARTSLIRIRLPLPLIELLDQLAERLRVKSRKRIPRAAIVRACVLTGVKRSSDGLLHETLGADPVKRGRERVRPKPMAAAEPRRRMEQLDLPETPQPGASS